MAAAATIAFDDGSEDAEAASDIQNGGVIMLPDSDIESEEEDTPKEKDDKAMDGKKRKRKDEKEKDKKKKKKKKKKRLPAPTPLPLKRHKIRLRNEYRVDDAISLEIREFSNMDVDGAVLVEGFPSKGLSSVMAASFLIKSMNLPLVGEVFSRAFPTVGRVSSYQSSNPIRIYGDKRVVVFLSEVVLEEPPVCWTMAQAILDFANRHRNRMLITLESLRKSFEIDLQAEDMSHEKIMELISARMSGRTEEEKENAASKVYEAALSPKASKGSKGGSLTVNTGAKDEPKAKKLKVASSSSSSSCPKKEKDEKKDDKEKKEGEDDKDEIIFATNDPELAVQARAAGGVPTKNAIIGGVTGCLIAESHTTDIPLICVISHHSALDSDDRAALNCLQFAEKLAGEALKIDAEPLKKKAASYEKQIKRALSEVAHGVKRRSKVSESMYM